MDISVTIQAFVLKFSVRILSIPREGSMSQNLDLGPSSNFMSTKGNFCLFFSRYISTFHKTKSRA